MKQTPTCVGDPPKKPSTKDKIEPLSFQRVGPKNKQLGVTWFKDLVVPFQAGKC